MQQRADTCIHYAAMGEQCCSLSLCVVPYCRNDTFRGPVGRRGDKVGGPYFMHADDLRKLAPQWLNYTYIMRNDSEVRPMRKF